MKKFNISLILALFVLGFVSCGPTTEDAIKYNDAIIEQQTILVKENDKVIDAMGGDAAKFEAAIKEFNAQVAKSTEIVEKMDKFGKETTFKDAALSLFKVFKSVGDNEYKEILRVINIPSDKVTKADEDQMMASAKQIDEKLQKELDAFLKSQKDFAEKYKFKLQAQ
jgi:hypothetical protein